MELEAAAAAAAAGTLLLRSDSHLTCLNIKHMLMTISELNETLQSLKEAGC